MEEEAGWLLPREKGNWKTRLLPEGDLWKDLGKCVAWWVLLQEHWHWAFESVIWKSREGLKVAWRQKMEEILIIWWWRGGHWRRRVEEAMEKSNGRVKAPLEGGRYVEVKVRLKNGTMVRRGVG